MALVINTPLRSSESTTVLNASKESPLGNSVVHELPNSPLLPMLASEYPERV